MRRNRQIIYFRIAFIGLILVTLFWTAFALLSGAEQAGGGIAGLIRNSPNAVPWLVALGALTLAHRFPVAVGLAFVAFAVLTLVQFDTHRHVVTFVFFTLPFAVFGALMAWSGKIGKR